VTSYDASEWKPGDVAMVTGRWLWSKPHSTKLALRDDGCWVSTGGLDLMANETSDARRLVVIDPEDAEQVERLTDGLYGGHGGSVTERVQAALREYANPVRPDPEVTYTDAEARAMRAAFRRVERTEGRP
jgi:hypothetical protein